MYGRQILKIGKSKAYSLKDYSKREVNLLPADYYKAGRIKIYTTLVIAFVIVAVGFFGFYEYSIYRNTKELEKATHERRVEIAKNQRVINNQNVIVSLDQRIAKKELLLAYIFKLNRPITEIVELFESTLNGEVYLSSLTVDSQASLVVSASALSSESIGLTINKLKHIKDADGNKYFDDVTTQGIVRNEDEDGNVLYLFQLNCEFGGVANEVE